MADEEREIRFLGDVRRLHLEPGDVIVLSHPMRLSETAKTNIASSLKRIFPDHTVVILEENMRIGLMGARQNGDGE